MKSVRHFSATPGTLSFGRMKPVIFINHVKLNGNDDDLDMQWPCTRVGIAVTRIIR